MQNQDLEEEFKLVIQKLAEFGNLVDIFEKTEVLKKGVEEKSVVIVLDVVEPIPVKVLNELGVDRIDIKLERFPDEELEVLLLEFIRKGE